MIVSSLWGFFVSIRPPRYLSDITPKSLGLSYEAVSFKTSDDLTLVGWWIPRQGTEMIVNAEGATETIVLLHGYPADKGNILPSLAYLSRTYNLFLFDFRYLGESDGKYSTAGGKEVEDLLAAIRYLKTRGVEQIGVWGFSMGGAVALMGAAQAPEIAALISESSYASLAKMAPQLYRLPLIRYPLAWLTGLWARLFIGINISDISPLNAAQKLTIPILLIHSETDEVIPFSHALALQEALKENPKAEFWFKEELIHGQLNQEYDTRIQAFFDTNLH